MQTYDIGIIGAGASGMASGIAALECKPDAKVLLIEKKEKPGRKLAASGNGRCNITNIFCAEYRSTADFLSHVGILLREEEQGRVYPYAGQAAQVADILQAQLLKQGASFLTGDPVISFDRASEKKGFSVITASGRRIIVLKLIVSCGGKAGPQYGTSGDGYAWARRFGHQVTKLVPVLTPLILADNYPGIDLKGVRAKAEVSLLRDGKIIASEKGEIQFTEYGVSGIAVFNLSRFVRIEKNESMQEGMQRYEISVDFLPEFSISELAQFLEKKYRASSNGFDSSILRTIVDDKIAETIVKAIFFEERARRDHLKERKFSLPEVSILPEHFTVLAEKLKAFRFGITKAAGWKAAQCTGGGIPLAEIEAETGESKLQEGLYFTGEILDYDGPCGGYNLNHAWLTGERAGRAAASALKTE